MSDKKSYNVVVKWNFEILKQHAHELQCNTYFLANKVAFTTYLIIYHINSCSRRESCRLLPHSWFSNELTISVYVFYSNTLLIYFFILAVWYVGGLFVWVKPCIILIKIFFWSLRRLHLWQSHRILNIIPLIILRVLPQVIPWVDNL